MSRGWVLLGLLLAISQVAAQERPDDPPAPDSVASADLSPERSPDPFAVENLEPSADGVMAGLFEAHQLAGAVVVIVKDGAVAFSKGYGYADLETRRPVDPAVTLFRIASLSKLFTWTAAMQLVEEGKVQLNTDVNQYLKEITVPATYDDPVTLGALMTHTAGFEDRVVGLLTTDSRAVVPFGEILREGLLSRVRPPGRVPAYSNYGAALGALVVQDVAGMPWNRVIQTRILDPLEMHHTLLVEPIPEGDVRNLAQGYSLVDGALAPQPFEIVPLLPAGGISATADDIAHFMLAHLNLGEFNGQRILEEGTARRMQAPLYQPDPRISGLAHGFILTKRGGHVIVGHQGDLRYFHSDLALVPSERLGLFVSFNSEEGAAARDEFVDAMFKRWYPQQPTPSDPPAAKSVGNLSDLSGTYRSTRRPVTTIGKFAEVLGYVSVTELGQGRLKTQAFGRSPRQWVAVAPDFYREWNHEGTLLFQSDSDRGPVRAFFGQVPIWAYDRLVWYQEPGFQLVLLTAEILVFLTTLVFPFIRRFIERSSDRLLGRREPAHPIARVLASLLSLVDLAFLVGLVIVLHDPTVLLAGVPPGLSLILVLPLVGGVLTVMLLVVAFFAWRGGYWHWAARLHFSLVTMAALTFLWQLSYWNMLGWQYP